MSPLYLKDLRGFRNLGAFTSPLKGNYGLFGRGKFLALVHLDDEEVTFIINKKKRTLTYQCPRERWSRPLIEGSIDALIEEASKL